MKFSSLMPACLILFSACASLPQPTLEIDESSITPTVAVSENTIPCSPENWVISITSVEQTDLGNGTKTVIASIGIENNDSLWGSVSDLNGSDKTEPNISIFLTTEDGSMFEVIDGPQFRTRGYSETPIIPPGFVTLGEANHGNIFHYNLSFLVPDTKTPKAITIGGIKINCILPHVIAENGQIVYRENKIQIPVKTYDLETDTAGFPGKPLPRRYPNLIGAELVTPDWKELIFITDVMRNGESIVVTFDFTNFSSHAVAPSFDGYLVGNNHFLIFQNDSKDNQSHMPVKPGQTAEDLTWTFTVPENETNLKFVYIYGGAVDLNKVFWINLD